MKRLLLPLAVILPALAGCQGKPIVATQHQAVPGIPPHDYVARRTAQLQAMGGPFKDNQDLARQKAQEEFESQWGSAATQTTTWAWGKGADRVQAQSEVNEHLNELGRQQR